MSYHAHAFVDGAYLRRLAKDKGWELPNPRLLSKAIVDSPEVQEWANAPTTYRGTSLTRIVYYDARPDADEDAPDALREYWRAIELLKDTHLGFGSLRGGTKRRAPRQKGVDTLIAVDMLVGAFTGLFKVAVLIAGDADFVPVVREVQRRGSMVVVAAHELSLSGDLRRAADRVVMIESDKKPDWVKPLKGDGGKTWQP